MQVRRFYASIAAAGSSVLSTEQLMLLLPARLKQLLAAPRVPKPLKIGVCVSGGADSMALAHLLKQAKHPLSPLTDAFEPHAFIVDHRARAGSGNEALSVKSLLSAIDVQSDILTMSWPSNADFSSMKNFELLARRKRYQLIAEAAVSHEIKYLFTGHHYDDQIETLISRLVRDHQLLKSSFLGIGEQSPIPECGDVFGARRISDVFGGMEASRDYVNHMRTSGNKHQIMLPESRTGLQLVRPLLTFPKHCLLATCVDFNVSFVNDPTNFDPTLTTRNAIRYLRSNHRLPQALSGDSLLKLQQQAFLSHDKVVQQARLIRAACELRIVSNQGLCVVFEIPASYLLESDLDKSAFAYFLARIAELVSCLRGSQIPSALDESFVRRFLHKCRLSEKVSLLTVCGALFHIAKGTSSGNGQTIKLMACRQPQRRGELKALRCTLHANSELQRPSSTSMYTTKWLLWDNRIWIRASSTEASELENLRVITSDEIYKRSCDLINGHTKYAKTLLGKLPLPARGSVPIVCRGSHIVGLPTFNDKLRSASSNKVVLEAAYPISERCYDFFGQSTEKVRETDLDAGMDTTSAT